MSKPTTATSPSTILALICALLFSLSATPGWAQETIEQRLKRIRELQDPGYEDFAAAEKDFKKTLKGQARRILARGTQVPLDDKRLEDWAAHRVKMMTNPKLSSGEIQEMTRSLVNQTNKAGLSIPNATAKKKFKEKLFDTLSKQAEVLLKNNYEARIAGINIIGSLNENTRPVVPYTKSAGKLLAVASNAKEVPVLRFLSFMHLNRMNKYGKISVTDEVALLKALSNALTDKGIPTKAADGFYLAVAGCLENIRRDGDTGGNPVAYHALADSMDDASRSYSVRAVSARAFALTGDKGTGVQYKVFAWKVAELTLAAAKKFNLEQLKNPGPKDAVSVTWRDLYDLAVAFRGEDGKVGILGRLDDAYTKDADNVVFPVVKGIMGNGVAGKKDIKKLEDWLKANRPATMKYHNNLPPFKGSGKADAKPNQGAGADGGKSGSSNKSGTGRTSAQAGRSGSRQGG